MIKIQVLSIDDGDDLIHYHFFADNGICSVGIEFYGYDDEFQNFASGLTKFPENIDDQIVFERGMKDDKYASYLKIKAYCYLKNGPSALSIDAWNNGDEQTKFEVKFILKAEPASLNKFGVALKNRNPKNHNEFVWNEYA
nr:hypothetical protein [Allomuricauda sp.]